MDIRDRNENGVSVVSPVGSVDAITAPELSEYLQGLVDGGHTRLVVDMTGIDYTSSAGLRVFLGMVKETRAAGGDIRLASTQPAVYKVLELSGFTSILKTFNDTPAAVASFAE